MTYTVMRVHSFACDRCGTDFEDLGFKREVWAACVKDGWIEVEGKHYCPKCTPPTHPPHMQSRPRDCPICIELLVP